LRLLPDLLSLSRLFASPLIVWLLVERRYKAALLVTLLAGLTDWFDGYTARKLGVSGKFGAVLDPLSDKILLVIVFIAMGILRLIPLWMPVLAILRDLVIVTGVLLLRFRRNIRKFRPVVSGKVSTFFQITLILMALIYAAYPFRLFGWLAQLALLLAAFFTVWSGGVYIRKGILMATYRWTEPGGDESPAVGRRSTG